jgi:hypothetical protein
MNKLRLFHSLFVWLVLDGVFLVLDALFNISGGLIPRDGGKPNKVELTAMVASAFGALIMLYAIYRENKQKLADAIHTD